MKNLLFAALLWALPGFSLSVTYLEGTADHIKGATQAPLKIKDKLIKGDAIKTAAASNVEIGSANQFKIRIMELSSFVVTEISGGTSVKFDAGNILVKVSKEWKARKKLTIETPTGAASIRGTEFWGQVNPSADAHISTFAVREGTIEFKPPWKELPISVSKGEAVVVNTKEETVLVRKALAAEMSAMEGIQKMDFKE